MALALLVDDKEENLYFLRVLLEGHGYQVQVAHHGAEALSLARAHAPDLVIADILMPVMDGFTLCRRWQADPALRNVPFVFYTATYTEPKDEHLAMSLGAARFIIKPKEPDEFMELINGVLEEHDHRQLRPPGSTPASEEQYLREYNAALIRKLEDKLVQLEERSAFTRAVLDAVTAPIAAVNPAGTILAVNRSWSQAGAQAQAARVLRLQVGDNMLGASLAGDEADNLRRLQEGLRAVLDGEEQSLSIELAYRGGESGAAGEGARYYTAHLERARAAGAGAVIACIDVTTLKRAEQATREASARKDEFLAVLGHELRNPLGAIKTATDVLNRLDLGDARARASTKVIERQTTNLSRIINDLLDVSRIGRGHMIVERQPTDLAEVVRASAEDSRSGFVARGVTLALDLPERPVWVLGDATRLAQVVDNLLANAQKFTGRGGRVDVRLDADDARRVGTLRVADSGIGMTAETLRRLFEPFEQAPQGRARTRGGLGLGLALVRGLVGLHGGEVHAESAGLGRGATLVVRLPLCEPPALRRMPNEASAIGLAGARVLIIEDNRDAAEVLRTLLEVAGSSVAVAHDGTTGIEVAHEYRPETIVCDIGLPGALDGYGVARTLRAEPAFEGTQLVAVTGYGQAEDVRRAMESGFDLHLTKPVHAPDLLAAVARSHEQPRRGPP